MAQEQQIHRHHFFGQVSNQRALEQQWQAAEHLSDEGNGQIIFA